MTAPEATLRRVRADIAAALLDHRAHCLEALDVLIDGADAEVAAARHRDVRMTEPTELHADEIIRRADAAHQLDRRRGVAHMAAIDLKGVAGKTLDLRAHVAEDLQQEPDIGNIRDIFDVAHAVYKQRCR